MPEVKGFSERNLKRMVSFWREYGALGSIVPQAAAQKSDKPPLPIVQQLVAQIPWFHNVLLMEKVKDLGAQQWYTQQTIEHGWSRNVLALQIDGQVHKRAGKLLRESCLRLKDVSCKMYTSIQMSRQCYLLRIFTSTNEFRMKTVRSLFMSSCLLARTSCSLAVEGRTRALTYLTLTKQTTAEGTPATTWLRTLLPFRTRVVTVAELRGPRPSGILWCHIPDRAEYEVWSKQIEQLRSLREFIRRGERILLTDCAALLPYELDLESQKPEVQTVEVKND